MTTLLNELRWNLETAKQMGNVEWQERLEKRIKSEEKAKAEPNEEESPEAVVEESTDLSDLTVKELREMAKDADVEGAATLKKSELIAALEA